MPLPQIKGFDTKINRSAYSNIYLYTNKFYFSVIAPIDSKLNSNTPKRVRKIQVFILWSLWRFRPGNVTISQQLARGRSNYVSLL